MVRFRVDEVRQAEDRLPTTRLAERFEDALAVADPDAEVVAPTGTHPLLGAVGLAFAQHRPLVLSPDAVWLTIAQGVAQHVRLHADSLRARLVRHQGKQRLTVELPGALPTDAAAWRGIVGAFRAQLAAAIGEGRARLFECDFSTSTETDRLASQIVLFDAYSPYFSMWITCVCGIPEITLTGTVADWEAIRARVDVIAELDLAKWCRSLVPILDELVRAARGHADPAFWKRIYNPVDAYGGEAITGWITRLYPYIKVGGAVAHPNPMLDLPITEPRDVPRAGGFYTGPGVRSDAIPATLSEVSVHVVDHVARDNRKVTLRAGVVAIAQEPDGALRPITGWHLAPASGVRIDEVLDRIAAEHATEPAGKTHEDGAAEMIALRRRFARVSLFGGLWKLVRVQGKHTASAVVDPLLEHRDGRVLALVSNYMTGEAAVAVGSLADLPAMQRLGSSLAAVLDGLLDANGEVDHMQLGDLRALLG